MSFVLQSFVLQSFVLQIIILQIICPTGGGEHNLSYRSRKTSLFLQIISPTQYNLLFLKKEQYFSFKLLFTIKNTQNILCNFHNSPAKLTKLCKEEVETEHIWM